MIFGYRPGAASLRKNGLLVALGIIAIPLSLHIDGSITAAGTKFDVPSAPRDPRVAHLRSFLTKLKCPVANLSEDFIRVADENHLDWRLLPSIAVIESGGGKDFKNNNIFGWDGGDAAFVTISSGLELVGYQLGRGPLYRQHDVLGKLRIYNEHDFYPDAVMSVMNRISPAARLRVISNRFQINSNAAIVRN